MKRDDPDPALGRSRMSSRPLTLEASPEADREEALRRLVTGRLEANYRLATQLLGDRNDAEEATHEAVVRALKASQTLRDVSSFDPWFRRILVNTCRDVGDGALTAGSASPRHPSSCLSRSTPSAPRLRRPRSRALVTRR